MRGKVFKVVFPMVLCLEMLLLPMDILADETQENVQEQQVIMNDETGIPDINFYNAVLESCDVNGDGVLTTNEVEKIEILYLQMRDIESIEGIQYFKNLKYVTLLNNKIEDISPLADMPLKNIDLRSNRISDISCLKDSLLINSLAQYAEKNPKGVSGTIGIRFMAGNNRITIQQAQEIFPEQLLNCKEYFYNYSIQDYEETNQTWFEREGFVDGTIIPNDASGIPDKNLYDAILQAGDENKDGFLAVYEAANITTLDARDKNITNLKGIEYCQGASYIYLSHNNISDVSIFEKFDNINQDIDLSYNRISDISFMSKFNSFGLINLSHNQISDISPLEGTYVGRYLQLDYNDISDITVFNTVKRIYVLHLCNNKISDISALKGTEIEELYITNNNISDISVLRDVYFNNPYGGGIVWVNNNPIKDISVLIEICGKKTGYNGYANLVRFDGNQIQNISDLDNLKNQIQIVTRYLNEDGTKEISPSLYSVLYKRNYLRVTCNSKAIDGYKLVQGEKKEIIIFEDTPAVMYVDFYYKETEISETDNSDYIVKTENNDKEITKEEFSGILKENINRNVIFKSNADITIKFAKGTMKEVVGKVSYDMRAEIIKDFDKLDNTAKEVIDKKNLVSYINYHYSGELPGEAEIGIYVGTEWSGKTLYYHYYDVENKVLQLLQEALVGSDGIMTVHQKHCSDYVILSEKITQNVSPEETEQIKTDEQDDTDTQEETAMTTSPNTGDNGNAFLIVIVCISGIIVVSMMKKDKVIY